MKISEAFKEQINYYRPLTQEVMDKVEFPVMWSGKRMGVGDKVLYAFVYERGGNDLKLITFLERELEEVEKVFNYIEITENYMPILSFKTDTKPRKPCFQTE